MTKKIVLMHCILNYPTKDKDANLNMILDLKKKFPNFVIGYSDHTLPDKNMLNVTTAFTLGVGFAFGGNVVIETVFSWPGLGRMLVFAVSASDYPLAQGTFLFLAAILIFMNFVADILYLFLDPRVSYKTRN